MKVYGILSRLLPLCALLVLMAATEPLHASGSFRYAGQEALYARPDTSAVSVVPDSAESGVGQEAGTGIETETERGKGNGIARHPWRRFCGDGIRNTGIEGEHFSVTFGYSRLQFLCLCEAVGTGIIVDSIIQGNLFFTYAGAMERDENQLSDARDDGFFHDSVISC